MRVGTYMLAPNNPAKKELPKGEVDVVLPAG